MRRTQYVLAAVASALALAAALLAYAKSRRVWTTDSRAALAAWEAGLEARMKFYNSDAVAGFRAAIAADPGFVAPKVLLLQMSDDEAEEAALVAELRRVDLERLTERERHIVELALAYSDHDATRAERLVEEYFGRHPDDPWALFAAANGAWERADRPRAEALYQRLLKVDPNWVIAHNNLGYLAMAEERFADAERHFRTYAYVAPDQANPHDSLGELLVLRGRYAEARSELEAALAIRPDFCASYLNLLGIALFEGATDQFEPVLERVERHCRPEMAQRLRCDGQVLAAYFDRDFEAPWRDAEISPCHEADKTRGPIYFRLALLTGHDADAAAEERLWEKRARELTERGRGKGMEAIEMIMPAHLAGVRQLAEGKAREAVASFRAADAGATYWGLEQGRMKLFNLLNLALALERTGDAEGSRAALAEVRAVNEPFLAAAYPGLAERTPGPPAR